MSAGDREPTPKEREAHERRRQDIVGRIPPSYRPRVHLVVPSLFGLGVCAAAIVALTLSGRALTVLEWSTLPITLVGGLGLEWRLHKTVLHRRRRGLAILYERHELTHHVVYTHDDMAMRSRNEMLLILLPPYAIVVAFGGVVPLALLVAALASTPAALLFVVASMAFFLSYEWLHLAYHLPPESRIGRTWLVRVLRELHRSHHDPALMKRWNFNVTIPLFDWLHGTLRPSSTAAPGTEPGPTVGREADAATKG